MLRKYNLLMEELRILKLHQSSALVIFMKLWSYLAFTFSLLRNRLEMPMFDEDLLLRRWHIADYKTIHGVFSDSETLGSFSISSADLAHLKPKN